MRRITSNGNEVEEEEEERGDARPPIPLEGYRFRRFYTKIKQLSLFYKAISILQGC